MALQTSRQIQLIVQDFNELSRRSTQERDGCLLAHYPESPTLPGPQPVLPANTDEWQEILWLSNVRYFLLFRQRESIDSARTPALAAGVYVCRLTVPGRMCQRPLALS